MQHMSYESYLSHKTYSLTPYSLPIFSTDQVAFSCRLRSLRSDLPTVTSWDTVRAMNSDKDGTKVPEQHGKLV